MSSQPTVVTIVYVWEKQSGGGWVDSCTRDVYSQRIIFTKANYDHELIFFPKYKLISYRIKPATHSSKLCSTLKISKHEWMPGSVLTKKSFLRLNLVWNLAENIMQFCYIIYGHWIFKQHVVRLRCWRFFELTLLSTVEPFCDCFIRVVYLLDCSIRSTQCSFTVSWRNHLKLLELCTCLELQHADAWFELNTRP